MKCSHLCECTCTFGSSVAMKGEIYFHPALDLYLKVVLQVPRCPLGYLVPRFRWIKPAWGAWLDCPGSFVAAVSLFVNLVRKGKY